MRESQQTSNTVDYQYADNAIQVQYKTLHTIFTLTIVIKSNVSTTFSTQTSNTDMIPNLAKTIESLKLAIDNITQ